MRNKRLIFLTTHSTKIIYGSKTLNSQKCIINKCSSHTGRLLVIQLNRNQTLSWQHHAVDEAGPEVHSSIPHRILHLFQPIFFSIWFQILMGMLLHLLQRTYLSAFSELLKRTKNQLQGIHSLFRSYVRNSVSQNFS